MAKTSGTVSGTFSEVWVQVGPNLEAGPCKGRFTFDRAPLVTEHRGRRVVATQFKRGAQLVKQNFVIGQDANDD